MPGLGWARLGLTRHGPAGRGRPRLDETGQGAIIYAWRCDAGRDRARRGETRSGVARHGMEQVQDLA